MNIGFYRDVFFSYAHEDLGKIKDLRQRLKEFGVSTFIADEDLRTKRRGTKDWESALLKRMLECRFFVLFCSRAVMGSDWVINEINHFYEEAYSTDINRKMFVLLPRKGDKSIIPEKVTGFLRPENEDELIQDVVQALIDRIREEREKIQEKDALQKEQLKRERDEARTKVREAFNHYGHKRFWEPFARNKDLHIFTCGREAGETSKRGARTNIDKWDYQTVLQITHYFAENYPATRVTIEDPVGKLTASDVRGPQLGHRVANLMRALEDKDCVIVGSPDVSDFAEIVLAEMHGIPAYVEKRLKKTGFAIIKSEMAAPSATYWSKGKDEAEGVAWIDKKESFEAKHSDGIGIAYGILVVCNNPFSHKENLNKVIILAGYTGVATYGIARLLTAKDHLDEFFKIDEKYNMIDSGFEALVKVPYTYDLSTENRDSREINMKESISLQAVVEIPKKLK